MYDKIPFFLDLGNFLTICYFVKLNNLYLKLINGHLLSILGAAPGPYFVRINAIPRLYLAGVVSYDNIVSESHNNRELIATLIPKVYNFFY